ncbi:MAG: hypothetical protein GTN99_07040 [Candidatus Dadabacteria bacterium]|nr:hypothetical protein [Candidatus Dadabacteria bacterium]
MDILKVFIGLDHRNPIDYTVLQHSIYRNASKPVAIIPLVMGQHEVHKKGLTDFTYARFLVPHLCNYHHSEKAIFMDSDMVVMDDVYKLTDAAPTNVPVSVVKNVQRFEWPSLMVFNTGHGDCKKLTPDYINKPENVPARFDWVKDGEKGVGELPDEWNYCVGYDDPSLAKQAKLLHYTMGTPSFIEIVECAIGGEYPWLINEKSAMGKCSWLSLHGNSVHAPKIIDRLREQTQ